jgi:hypothetical protein
VPDLGLRASPGDLILGLSWQRQNTRRASVGAFARSSSGRLLSSEVFGRFAFFSSFITSVFFLALLLLVVMCQKGKEMR